MMRKKRIVFVLPECVKRRRRQWIGFALFSSALFAARKVGGLLVFLKLGMVVVVVGVVATRGCNHCFPFLPFVVVDVVVVLQSVAVFR